MVGIRGEAVIQSAQLIAAHEEYLEKKCCARDMPHEVTKSIDSSQDAAERMRCATEHRHDGEKVQVFSRELCFARAPMDQFIR